MPKKDRSKTIKYNEFVTINGEEPKSPKSFFQTKKFLVVAGLFGGLVVAVSFLMFFH